MNLLDLSFCETPAYLRAIFIVKIIVRMAFIIAPIMVIVLSTIKFLKVATNGRAEDMKEAGTSLFRRIAACFLVILSVFVIPGIIDLLAGNKTFSTDFNLCITNATGENIEKYDKIDKAYGLAANALMNPTKSNIEEARGALYEVMNYASEDHVLDLLKSLSDAEVKSKMDEEIKGCVQSGGKYDGGYCFKLEQLSFGGASGGGGSAEGGSGAGREGGGSGGQSSSSGGSSESGESGGSDSQMLPDSGGSGRTKTMSALGATWIVPDTKSSVADYHSFITKTHFAETKNLSRYSDHCLGFAYAHSYGMYTGNKSIGAENGYSYWSAGKFTSYDNNDKTKVLQLVYQEINAGRPVVIQVNGNKKGTSRHYVSCVGYKNTVKSASELTEKDLLIIDSYDGKMERMDTSSSRFMITGAACHKKYSGYQAYYIKH